MVPIRTVTVTGTVLPSGAVEGATLQVAFVGAPVQLSVMLPLSVEGEESCRLYMADAVVPPESVAVVEPVGASVKSMPVPESVTVCMGAGALSRNVMAPVAAPAAAGAKATSKEQAAFTASVAAQVLAVMTNPGDAVTEEMFKVWPPLLVSIRDCG